MISFADLCDASQSGQLTSADIDALLEQMYASVREDPNDPNVFYVSVANHRKIVRFVAIGRRYARWQGIRRRQRRAAQRRHNRGGR